VSAPPPPYFIPGSESPVWLAQQGAEALQHLVDRRRREIEVARHHVRIAARDDDEIAGRHLDWRLAFDFHPAGLTFGENMEQRQTFGFGRQQRLQLLRGRRNLGPRTREFRREEHGAGQPNDAQRIGENVHREPPFVAAPVKAACVSPRRLGQDSQSRNH
jgi:hypothetical protein